MFQPSHHLFNVVLIFSASHLFAAVAAVQLAPHAAPVVLKSPAVLVAVNACVAAAGVMTTNKTALLRIYWGWRI